MVLHALYLWILHATRSPAPVMVRHACIAYSVPSVVWLKKSTPQSTLVPSISMNT